MKATNYPPFVVPKNRLRRFPEAVQREIKRRLTEGDFDSLRALSQELRARGYHIGKSALSRLAQNLRAGRVRPRPADIAAEQNGIPKYLGAKR